MTTRKTPMTRITAVAVATGSLITWQILNDSPSAADSARAPVAEVEALIDSAKRMASPQTPSPGSSPDSAANQTRAAEQARSAGATWLVEHQNADGGWGAGDWGQGSATAQSDVATTALAAMALLRDDPMLATHSQAFERGVAFVVKTIEDSPLDGPRLRGPDGTQPQHKLGRNVDTHFASLLLGEVTGRVSPALEKRITLAYDKVLTKVVSAQRGDGSFDQDGWAPVLSSSVAAQGLYKALENGKALPDAVMDKADAYQSGLVDAEAGEFDASRGAGVMLYSAASGLRGNANAEKRPGGLAAGAADARRFAAKAVRADDGALIAGFGSMGGEEMLSYMMISDTLAEGGGEDWTAWQKKIGDHLRVSQNNDGSWSGHHCITSTPFVTAAAVMTLGATPEAETQRHSAAEPITAPALAERTQ